MTNTLAQEKDSITITTYYPSPYGVYKRLRLHPSIDCETNTPCKSIEEGELCYYSSGTDKTLNVCDGVNWKSALASGAGTMTSYPQVCEATRASGTREDGLGGAYCLASCAPGFVMKDWECDWDPDDGKVTRPTECSVISEDGVQTGKAAQDMFSLCPGTVLEGKGTCERGP